jgi:teichuronic acid biosynthesis glycosyltransferase TuaC
MRVLVVTNMYPTPAVPARGRFVFDQVQALRRLPDVQLELYAFTPGRAISYAGAAATLASRYRRERFDVVHAHFGLTAWPALAVRARAHAVTLHGTDLAHPRSRRLTLAALPLLDLTACVSQELADEVPRRAVRGRPVAVLPCGVDMDRFVPVERDVARRELGLDPDDRYLLFPQDPGRAEKRYDRARSIAQAVGVELLTLGSVPPERVPLYINAANAVLVTSEREGFGLAVLEALACNVPVLATPHGVAVEALSGVAGTYCGEFEVGRWRAELAPHLLDSDPRVAGRERAQLWSAVALAERVADAWRALLA